jgi:hypothetical protein
MNLSVEAQKALLLDGTPFSTCDVLLEAARTAGKGAPGITRTGP